MMSVVKWIVVAVALQLAAPYAYTFARHDFTVCTGMTLDPRPYTPTVNVRGARGRGTLRLVPLDEFPTATLQALADYYREKYDLDVELAPSLDITAATYDAQRQQLNADALIDRLETAHPQHPGEALVVIGLVADDIYIPTFNWRYALSYRRDDRYAVVSSARMDYGCLGLVTASSDRIYTRLRKMVSKNVGILYYRLPVSDDPRSVLYGSIGGVQEFDRMTDDF